MSITPTVNRAWRRLAVIGVPLAAAIVTVPIITTALPAAADPVVSLGTASSFGVLAGAGITNTGPTTIIGDIGSFPTATVTGVAAITLIGTDHGGDSVTQGAKDALVTAYDDVASRPVTAFVPVELGGTTLLPGVYASGTFGLTGVLTLNSGGDPNATFVFQAASTLITEANSGIVLIGVDPCRVVWQVGSSATFKTGTTFAGDVLAYTSITAQTNATFDGRLLARNGAVTLDTNTITKADCAPALPAATTTTTAPATTTTTSTSTTTTAPATTTTTSTSTTAPIDTPAASVNVALPGTPAPIDTPAASVNVALPGTPAPTLSAGPPPVVVADVPPATSSSPPSTSPNTPPSLRSNPPAQRPPSLPVTGMSSGPLLVIALGLIAIGAFAVLVSPRRRWGRAARPTRP